MEHTSVQLREQLEQLSELILRLGGLAEEAIGKSVRALVDRDSDLARQVLSGDTPVDALELEIDDLCVEILARHQPLARDLRFVATAMKITPDLERIADHAVNVAERTLELNDEPPLTALVDMPLLAGRAQRMVRDAQAALDVIRMDTELDQRMEQVFRVLLSYMLGDPKTISRALRMMFVAKCFERIGDQATNICEQIVYMTEARVIKHKALGSP
jgi:phosphate transport system protein